MNNGQMDRANENPNRGFALMTREATKKPSGVGCDRDLNSGPPE